MFVKQLQGEFAILNHPLFPGTHLSDPREWQNVDLNRIQGSDKNQNLVELALQNFSIFEEFTYVNILQHKHAQTRSTFFSNEYLEHTLKMPTKYITPQYDILVFEKGSNISH